jgi:hypothetical protein
MLSVFIVFVKSGIIFLSLINPKEFNGAEITYEEKITD